MKTVYLSTLSVCGLFFCASIPASASPTIVVPANAVWKYLGNGTDLGTAWIDPAFDDSSWLSGAAQLGYGDGDETTVVTTASPRPPTVYFRQTVVLSSAVSNATVRLLRDDGAVVYVNGIEVMRNNMPAGPVTFNTLATASVGGVEETSVFINAAIPSDVFLVGANVIAVEIHQNNLASTDMSFALELSADSGPPPPVITVETVVSETREIPPWSAQPLVPAVFRITRTGTNGALAVYFRLSGTASNGVDYEFVPGAIIQPGHQSTEVYISPHDDELVEGTESVVLTLQPGPCPQCYAVGNPATATAYILDNDATNTPPTIFFYLPADGATFTAPADITLRASADDQEDGNQIAVEFFEGSNRIGQGTFVPTLCPSPYCPFFALTWSNVPPGHYTLTAKATDHTGAMTVSLPVHITVVGDPFPTLVRIEATGRIAEESSEPFRRLNMVGVFTISHMGPTNEPVSIFVQYSGSATPGVDYPDLPWIVTIPAGSRSTEIRVEPHNDRIPEGIETLVATLSDCPPDTDPPLGMPCFATPIDPAHERATVFIRDDGITEASLAITKPADGTSFRARDTILIEATAIDLEGYISRVEFWDGERRIGVSEIFFIQPPDPGTPIHHSFEWHGAAPGAHVLRARASRAGTALQSQPVNIYLGMAKPDRDGDGVPNEIDLCPNTPSGASVDAHGCSADQRDSDHDGVPDSRDQCPNTPANALADEHGCSANQRDRDGDGIVDSRDQCPGTPPGIPVDAHGCPLRPTNCPPRIAWERSFGGSGYEYISQMQQTPDGGYVLGGSSLSGAGGNKTSVSFGMYDIWIVRLDAQGNKLWERSFGGSGDDGLSSIALTADGGFIIGGLSDSGPGGNKTSPNYGNFDLWLLRLDGQGNKLWEKSFGGSRWDGGGAAVLTADGGFIVAATSDSPADGNKTSPNRGRANTSDLWVLRLNASGEKLWERTFGGGEQDSGAAVQQTADGGFVLAGQTSSGTGGHYDGWVVRLDADGNKLWDRTYGGTGQEGFGTLGKTEDGGFVLGGWTTSGPGGNKTSPNFGGLDSWIVRVDASGALLWEQTFGGIDEERLITLRLTPDGGIVFGSSSQSPLSGNRTTVHLGQRDWWIVRLAADGSEVWQRTVGGSGDDEFRDVLPLADGGYLLAGNSDSTDGDRHSPDFGGYGDFWVVRLLPESAPHCDRDADGVADEDDQCPNTPAGAVVNANGCSIVQLCPCDGPWRNHGKYVNAVRDAASAFYRAGLITRRERQEILRAAAKSDCGRRRPKLSMPLQCADELRTNGCRLILEGDGGVTCIVESSVDLVQWTPISTNRLSGVAIHISDPDAGTTPRRFYRVRSQ